MFKDKIKDWYETAKKTSKSIERKVDTNYKRHYIKPCQMITLIGPSGAGKSKTILEFLSRKNDAFYKIILFSGSTADEPLYNLLHKVCEDIELLDDPEQLPELTDMNQDEKKHEKLIIFDDIINLPKKQLLKIQKWYNSSRKYGYTCISTAQNYTDLPIQMRRNTMIFILFKMNDVNTINQILKNHNTNGDDPKLVRHAFYKATEKSGDFFMLDCNATDDKRYRHNFTDFIDINK